MFAVSGYENSMPTVHFQLLTLWYATILYKYKFVLPSYVATHNVLIKCMTQELGYYMYIVPSVCTVMRRKVRKLLLYTNMTDPLLIRLDVHVLSVQWAKTRLSINCGILSVNGLLIGEILRFYFPYLFPSICFCWPLLVETQRRRLRCQIYFHVIQLKIVQ